jgi:farnesyl-diphosphate farnesyltransferase
LSGDEAAAASLAAAAAGAGDAPDLDLVAHLPRVLRVYAALPAPHRAAVGEGVSTLAAGMRGYAGRAAARGPAIPYLDTEAELEDYCWVVAGCVGVMLTRLYAEEYGTGGAAAQEQRLALAPRVGEALQLTNILLDWPTDLRRGRCYLPAAWLAEAGVTAGDLVESERPGAGALARRLEAKALAALERVPDYIDLIPARHLRYRLFCMWPAMWAVRSLRQARRDPQFPWGPRRPKLPRMEVYRSSLASLLVSDHGNALRRLCATGSNPLSSPAGRGAG